MEFIAKVLIMLTGVHTFLFKMYLLKMKRPAKCLSEHVCIAKNIELAANSKKPLLEYTRWLTAREVFQFLYACKGNPTKKDTRISPWLRALSK